MEEVEEAACPFHRVRHTGVQEGALRGLVKVGNITPYDSVQIRELKLSPRHLQAVLLQITTLVMDWSGCGTQIDPRF